MAILNELVKKSFVEFVLGSVFSGLLHAFISALVVSVRSPPPERVVYDERSWLAMESARCL